MSKEREGAKAASWYKGENIYRTDSMRVRALPYRRASRRASTSMGSSLSRAVKTVRSDGNGNVEPCQGGQGEYQDKNLSSPSVQPTPVRVDLLLDLPPESKDQQLAQAWNPRDRSLNIFVKEDDPFTFHRHPVAQSTDCVRGKVGYKEGLHLFEFTWPSKQRGTHAVLGVATDQAPLHSPVGYQSLVGSTSDSWGWDLGRIKAFHNSDSLGCGGIPYPTQSSLLPTVVPDTILMVLNMELGTLCFVVDGRYLGVAHSGLKGRTLYPIVSSVWGHCEVSMRHLAYSSGEPPSLSCLARRSVRKTLGSEGLSRGDTARLGLPTTIKQYLTYQ